MENYIFTYYVCASINKNQYKIAYSTWLNLETSIYPVCVAREGGIKSKAAVSLLAGINTKTQTNDIIVNVFSLM